MSRVREEAKGGPVVLFAFGALMAVQVGVCFAFTPDAIVPLLLGGVSASSFAVGLGMLAWRLRRPPDPNGPMALTDLSMSTALLGAGIAGMALGAYVGAWMLLIGGGAILVALGGLVRERRARPR